MEAEFREVSLSEWFLSWCLFFFHASILFCVVYTAKTVYLEYTGEAQITRERECFYGGMKEALEQHEDVVITKEKKNGNR